MEELQEEEEPQSSPLKYFFAILLIFLLVITIFPYYSIKLDPSPKNIPTLDQIDIPDFTGKSISPKSLEQYYSLINKTDPYIKTLANSISSISCPKETRICYAKAIYLFTRDNFNYISDPIAQEYVEEPKLFLASRGGDCESGTLFMANLMESIGIDSQIVFIPGHAYLRIYLPESRKKYQDENWIYLDWTCSDCEFGEIPYQNVDAHKTFIDV